MEQLKNIVFDFGGVLIDWNPVYLYRDVFETEEEMNYSWSIFVGTTGIYCRMRPSLAEPPAVQENIPDTGIRLALY